MDEQMKLDYIAIILSVLAVVISLMPTLDALITFDEAVENRPSFDMPVTQYHGNLIMGPITTSFFIVNNGSATAHDIHVRAYYEAHIYDIHLEEYVTEIEQGDKKTLYFPIGWRQLEMAWGNYGEDWGTSISNYTITIWIDCRENPNAQRFEFIMH
jgi:hypothetical protein